MAASARGGASRWTAGAFVALVATCGSTLSEREALAQATVGLTVQVDDASTGLAWTNTESTGAKAYDSAFLSWSGPIPTGTVTYDFYTNGTCAGVYTVTDPETVDGNTGSVNHSFFTTPLGAGTYSYLVTYSGDTNYPSTQAACQQFTVQQSASATVSTSVFDEGTGTAWSGGEVTGASAYDTATVSGTGGVAPTGTVTYSFYADGSCTGNPVTTDQVSLSNGSVPNSSATAALGAGAYSYQAAYSGDSSYQNATGACEGFAVAQASDSFVAAVYDASNNQPWSGTEIQGASAYDAASLGATGTGFTPTGTVTYALFQSAGCAGNPSSTETVTVAGGSVPASSATPGLPAGTYSYQASYSGDVNFTSANVCNTFTVNSNPLTISPPSLSNVSPGSTVTLNAQGGTGVYTQWTLTTDGSGAQQPQPPFGATLSYVVGPIGTTTDIVQVTDSSGATAQATIGVGPGISISLSGSTPVPPMGSLGLSATGGSGGPYSWAVTTDNSGATTPLPSGTSTTYTAGSQGGVTDTITASDTYGNTATVQIAVGAGIAITANPGGTVGPGEPVTLTASGGSSTGYQWKLSTNASGAGALNPTTGGSTTYTPGTAGGAGGATDTVQVTDSLGNVGTIAVKVGATLAMADPQGVTTPPHGTLQFTVSGGWSSCTNGYQWSVSTNDSGGGVDSTGLYTAGSQGGVIDTVTVTDCASNSASMSVNVTSGVSITATPSATTWPHGQVTLTASGGSGTFSAWSFTSTGSGSPQLSATLGASTTYTAGATASSQDVVQVKDSLGNVATITLTVGAGITITNYSGASTPPMGSLQFSASGGSGSYATWVVSTDSSGAGPISPSSSTTGGQVTYTAGSTGGVSDTITVTDTSGNTASVNVSVGGGIAINPANPSTPPRGSVSFGATGGSGAGFKWSIVANGSGGSIGATTGAYVAGGAGNAQDTVQVIDSLGNTATTTVTVGPGVSISPSSATVAPLGVATFSASGGSGTGYSWSLKSNSSGGNVVGGAYKAGPTGGGVDVVQVVDSLGNVATANVSVTAALTLAPSAPSTPPRGSVAFSAMGGAKSYKWSLQTNGSGGSINPGTGLYVAGSTGGTTDTVLVTDANGATASTVVDVTAGVTITPPTPSTPPGGTIDFMAVGGSGTGYLWAITTNLSGGSIAANGVYVAGATPKVTDVVRVTDSLGNTATVSVSVGGGIAISPNSPTVPPRGSQTFTATGGSGGGYAWKLTASPSGGSVNASTGAYTAGATPNLTDVLQVTDSLGNTGSTNITVGAGVAINPATTTTAPLGTVHFAASGGSGNGYTYSLTTNASAGKIDPTTGTYTAGAIGNATDTIKVTDSLGNSATATVEVSAAIAIAPTTASVPPRGAVSFTATGGTGSYAFALQTNASGGSVTAQGAYVAGATPNVVDVVGVVDTNGATATAAVIVGAGVTLSPVAPSVAPGGKVQFTAMGGSGTGFLWTMPVNQSGGGITVGGAYAAGNTGKTVDTVKVTDSLGNSATTQVSVGGGLAINPSTASAPPLGKVSFGAVGGAGGYVFSLGTNASGGAIDKMGNYTAGNKGSVTDVVTVTDAMGTTASADVAVGPGVTVTPATATVMTGGTIPFSVSGGSGTGYAWTLQPNQSGGTIDPKTGVYKTGTFGGVVDTVLSRDSLGNVGSASVTVKGNPMMGGDGGVDGGMTDSGMPTDGGRPMDGASGNDGATSGDGAPSGDGDNQDSGFEVDGSGIDAGAGPGNNNGSCGCSVVGVDGEGFGALGGLALGLALLARRRRIRTTG